MIQPDRHRIVRVRQRSATTLRAFSDPLTPVLSEIGIDRMQVNVSGSWRVTSAAFTASDYRTILTTPDPEIDWLRNPNSLDHRVVLGTRLGARTTLSFTISVYGWARGGGQIKINFGCNPTRTLAHLLVAYGHEPDFLDYISGLHPLTFFAKVADMPLSVDGKDNWLSDLDGAHAAMGSDIFAAFLPVYVEQLQALSMRFIEPYDEGLRTYMDGSSHVAVANGCTVKLDWGSASAPQIETYFERYHGQAPAVIRSAAQTILSAMDHASVRHHFYNTGFERAGDLFSMVCELPNELHLAIYAKALTRIRFEVRRKKGGRYPPTTIAGPTGRLLEIMSSEREKLLHACQWPNVAKLFVEQGVPVIGDLVALVSEVTAACELTEHEVQPVIRALLIDGSISRPNKADELVVDLARRGVLERNPLRNREGPLPYRYVLTADYLAAYQAILAAFSGSEDTSPRINPAGRPA